jgi:hypothetical protein
VKHSLEKTIPAHRIVLYGIIASFLPVFFAFAWAQSAISSAENDRASLLAIGERLQKKSASQERNRQILLRFREKDPLFLHRRLEPLHLLSTETSILRSRLERSALPDDAQLEKRLRALEAENSFCFIEGSTDLNATYKETLENQNKLVEVNTQDLVNVITILDTPDENDDPQKPHLIISEARLERKKGLFQETWGLMLKVIRREYS